MVPDDSDCRLAYGVYLQAVYGRKDNFVNDGGRFLMELANRTDNSQMNFWWAPRGHGEMFDFRPCWLFVPICGLDFIKCWQPRQGYKVLAIAGAWDEGVDEESVTAQLAYQYLCTARYTRDITRDIQIRVEKRWPISNCSRLLVMVWDTSTALAILRREQ
jgi:hypothetical protein